MKLMRLYFDILKKVAVGSAQASSYADREFDRFFAVAVPTQDGLGLYDPDHGTPDLPTGVAGEEWRDFQRDYCRLGGEPAVTLD